MLYGYFYKSNMPEELGQTSSGKKVYSANAGSYSKEYSPEDHLDAAKVHERKFSNLQGMRNKMMLKPNPKPDLAKLAHLQDQQNFHQKQIDFHKEEAAKDPAMAKAIALVDLLKGGPGSGQKGHHTDRKPYPGEEAHNIKPGEEKPEGPQTLKWEDLPPEHSMGHNLVKYKKLLKLAGPMMEGNFTYDPKTDSILAISDAGKAMIRRISRNKQLEHIKAMNPPKGDFSPADKLKEKK